MAYADGSDLVSTMDRRDLANLLTEDADSPVDPSNVEGHPVAQDALEMGAARIKGACLIANKYTEEDLDRLAAQQDMLIVRLNCWLAIGELLGRRGVQKDNIPPYVARAEEWIKELKKGEMLFNVTDNRDKGNVQTGTAEAGLLENQGFVTANLQGRFFPFTNLRSLGADLWNRR